MCSLSYRFGPNLSQVDTHLSYYKETDAAEAFRDVYSLCVQHLGPPTEHHDKKAIWDMSDGNVILLKTGALGLYYQLNLMITSDAIRAAL